MHELNRARGTQGRYRTDPEQGGAGQHEKGAQPLAAAQACIAHGLEDAGLALVAFRQQPLHGALGRLGGERQGGVELAVR